MNAMRQRVWRHFEEVLRPFPIFETCLDFGSGDGWFAYQMLNTGKAKQVQTIDVQHRKHEETFVEPLIYDGGALPFSDRAFDLSYSVNVLHHCPDPIRQLEEVLRCTNRYLLLKDHTYSTRWGQLLLCAMDEIGNRRVGIPSLYKYQKRWEWFSIMEQNNFVLRRLIYPAKVHVGFAGQVTNPLQFIALWERAN